MHPIIHAYNHPSVHLPTHSFIHQPIHSPTLSFIHHPSVHSSINSPIQTTLHPSAHPPSRPLIQTTIHRSIHPSIRSPKGNRRSRPIPYRQTAKSSPPTTGLVG